jgi:hypothetical protein
VPPEGHWLQVVNLEIKVPRGCSLGLYGPTGLEMVSGDGNAKDRTPKLIPTPTG